MGQPGLTFLEIQEIIWNQFQAAQIFQKKGFERKDKALQENL